MFNGKKKNKVEVSIFIAEDGNIGIDFSSDNLVTVLGMVEMGKMLIQKKLLLDSIKPKEEESAIIKPRLIV